MTIFYSQLMVIRKICLIVLLASSASAAHAIIYKNDMAYGGEMGVAASMKLATEPAFAAVGKVDYTFYDPSINENVAAYGTGTLINNEWVLTAAHLWPTGSSLSLSFKIGAAGAETIYTGQLSSLSLHPNWTIAPYPLKNAEVNLSQGWDIALFRLTQPVSGITPAKLYEGANEWDQYGYTVGYGRIGSGTVILQDNTLGSKLAMQNVIDRVTLQGSTPSSKGYTGGILVSDFDGGTLRPETNTLVSPGFPVSDGNQPLFQNPFGTVVGVSSSAVQTDWEGGTAKGDSGGPTFINDGGVYKIAGITSWGTNPANGYDYLNGLYGDLTYMTRVSQQTLWINSVIQGALPATYNYTTPGVISDSLTGFGRLQKSGTGSVSLTAENSYSGGSLIEEGELVAGHNLALGLGRITLSGGSLILNVGIDIQNPITITDESATVVQNVVSGTNFAGILDDITSELGNVDTTALLLYGTSEGNGTLTASFRTNSTATNDAARTSDVFSLSWNSTDSTLMATYAFELYIDTPLTSESFLAWLDEGSNMWVNAVNGNIGGTPNFVIGEWNAIYGLGTYGVNLEQNTVWAVLNHNSDFSVVPEPHAITLALLGFAFLLMRYWRKSCAASRPSLNPKS